MRLLAVGASLLVSACLSMAASASYDVYTSGYAADINLLRFTPPSTLQRRDTLAGQTGAAPSWLTFLSTPSAGSRRTLLVTDESAPGGAYLLDRLSSPPSFRASSRAQTKGDGSVASAVSGSCVYVANYDSGSLSVLPLSYTHKSPDSGGSPRLTPKLGDASAVLSFTRNGTGPVSNRQDGSYAHDVVVSPDGAYVFVCDLGADVIRVIRPASSACKDAAHVADIPLGAGSGPRHLKFFVDAAKGKTFAYLSSEFANTITSFLYAPTASSDEVLQQIGEPSFSSPPTLPLGGNKADGPKRTLAEVQVAPNGRFVFASNRGDSQEDSISVLTRGDNGRASWTYWYRSGGLNPRHFDVSPDGQYLSVANQDSGNVVVLRVSDKDGSLDKVATLGGLPKVAFAGFAPADK